jgi:hypothetical protein
MLCSRINVNSVKVANEDRKILRFADWFPAFCLHVMGKWGEVSDTIGVENDTILRANYGTVKSELETLSGLKVCVETVLPNGRTSVRLVKS